MVSVYISRTVANPAGGIIRFEAIAKKENEDGSMEFAYGSAKNKAEALLNAAEKLML